MEQAEGRGEGELEHVNNQKEPRAGADEVFLRECQSDKIDGHDRASRVGHHRAHTSPDAHRPGEGEGVGNAPPKFRESCAQSLQYNSAHQHPAKERPETRVR